MVRTCAAIFFAVLAIGLAFVTHERTSAEAVGGFNELQRAEVAGNRDLEVVMGLIERRGESASEKHYHPGGEFGFVLEGPVTVISEGKSEVSFESGSSFHQPPGEWHIVRSTAEGSRTVVFRVVEKGQPMVVSVE